MASRGEAGAQFLSFSPAKRDPSILVRKFSGDSVFFQSSVFFYLLLLNTFPISPAAP